MTYRDDREADQLRIAALERELADARKRVAELEGRSSQALVLAGGGPLARTRAQRWFGGPMHLEMTRKFDGVYPTERFEDLIEVCRAHVRDPGRSEVLRTSLTWWSSSNPRGIGPFLRVTVTARDGATTLVVGDRLSQLAGAIYGGVGGGVGGGLIVVPILASITMPALAPLFALGWIGGTFALTRTLFATGARRRAVGVQRLFDALAAEIAAYFSGSITA